MLSLLEACNLGNSNEIISPLSHSVPRAIHQSNFLPILEDA